MSQISVFEFMDYKTYLTQWISSQKDKRRGLKSALAAAATCQTAYLSRVFNGEAHLNLEQAHAINDFLGHSEDEAHQFLLLVQFARAGTSKLRAYFQRQLDSSKKRQLVLKERFKVKVTLSKSDQMNYYSSWHYAAIHLLVSVPAYQSREAIARYLGLPKSKVHEILEFLQSVGLVAHEGEHYKMGTSRIHLGSDSPLIARHHSNWRMQAIRSFDRDDRTMKNPDLHYSSIVSMSEADFSKAKSMFIKMIDEFNSVVRDSGEEAVFCLGLDFFQV